MAGITPLFILSCACRVSHFARMNGFGGWVDHVWQRTVSCVRERGSVTPAIVSPVATVAVGFLRYGDWLFSPPVPLTTDCPQLRRHATMTDLEVSS